MERKKKIAVLGALAAGGCLLRSEYEKNQLKTCHYVVKNDKIPRSFDGVRLVLLADLHGKQFGPGNERLYEAVRAAKPDYILSAGDIILKTKPWETEREACFLGCLARLCPVYCGNGNHELELKKAFAGETSVGRPVGSGSRMEVNAYDRYTCRLEQLGITVLSDSTAVLTRNGESIDVTGLDLGLAFYAKAFHVPMRPDYMNRKLGTAKPDRFHILLGHYPNYFPEYAAWGADLVLAGHMHGGTVRLPKLGGLMSPNYEFFPSYDRGYYERENSAMVVSGGLGTHSVNIRFGGNDPQLPVIVLKRNGDGSEVNRR